MSSLAVRKHWGIASLLRNHFTARAAPPAEATSWQQDPVRTYEIQKIRVGVQSTLLIFAVAAVTLFAIAPQDQMPLGTTLSLLIASSVGLAMVLLMPWERLLGSALGAWSFVAWSVFDIVLISLAIYATGNASSELFYLFGLTTTLFAISYSPRVQAAFLGSTVVAYSAVAAALGWSVDTGVFVLRLAILGALAILAHFLSRELTRLLSGQHDVMKKMHELESLRSDFLSTVSHELRTPLAAIRGFASTLGTHWKRMDDTMRTDLVARIGNNAEELDHLIAQLLHFSLIDRGRIPVDARLCPVEDVITRTVDRLGPVLAGHEVVVDAAPDSLALADAAALSRVLENLLVNASKFSTHGTSITVWTHAFENELVVAVDDEGEGVPAEEAHRVFERFYRVERGDSARNGGTGIGLAIVKQIVQAHSGHVWVEPRTGGGSSFRFTLPRYQESVRVPQTSALGSALGPSAIGRSLSGPVFGVSGASGAA